MIFDFVLVVDAPSGHCRVESVATIILFSQRLKAWRGKRLQKEACEDLGVSLPTYRKWEYGKRTPDKVKMMEIDRRMLANPDTRKL